MTKIGCILRGSDGLWLVTAADGEELRVAPVGPAGEIPGGLALGPQETMTEAGAELPAGLAVNAAREAWRRPDGLSLAGRVVPAVLDRFLREKARRLAQEHYDLVHAPKMTASFDPQRSAVPVAGRVYESEEIDAVLQSGLDLWLTTGRFNDAFERGLAAFLGLPHVLTVNSGSSANLLAVTALTSPKLGEKALKPGDEVITVAAGFPTTVNPILQNNLVPVFVDVDLETLNVLPDRLEGALSDRTRAVVLAHTLGNPFNVAAVLDFCRRHDLWLIEDCCDALGSQYALPQDVQPFSGLAGNTLCGTFGHIASFSFYPAHHITMGEGGAVATADPLLKKILESFRDWGRDCWCPPGHDNTCRRRFGWKWGQLPEGYDHKYVYSHVGYNLKISDMQAAVGVAQLQRLAGFIERRRENYRTWQKELADLSDLLIMGRPTAGANPSWFGLPLTLRSEEPGLREKLMERLNAERVGTRLLFGGNMLRQPYFQGRTHRVAGSLANTDAIMARTFWLGVFPGLKAEHIAHAAAVLRVGLGR